MLIINKIRFLIIQNVYYNDQNNEVKIDWQNKILIYFMNTHLNNKIIFHFYLS